VYDTARKDTEYLNNHPEEKAEEFMQAFEDPEVKGVIALTGGSEQLRILKYLEPERIKDNPTRFYGISDNTNLHTYLWDLGIQSFYGGQVLDDLLSEGEVGEYTYRYLEKAFFEDNLGKLEPSEQFTDDFFDLSQNEIIDDRTRYDSPDWEFWNFNGEIKSQLFGGCLGALVNLLMSDKHPDPEKLEGKILALETSEENPSIKRIKWWMMNMGERGFLQKFSAIIVARPMREPLFGEDKTLEEKKSYHQKQRQKIKEEINRYCPETPVVFNMDFGHTHPKIPLKLGGKLRIDPKEEEIRSL
jgi:muramoyltetrapeptide carboxypeptidase LdcA involved in peptidoglycan recycling